MKYLLFLTLTIFCSKHNFGQINRINILLLQTDTAVTKYYEYLNSKKANADFRIEKNVTGNGDLTLACQFWGADEEFFKCLSIMAIFDRINGRELCVIQTIMGSVEYANIHLSYIKDNFKSTSAGKWEKPFGGENKLKIVATFERISTTVELFKITYEVKDQ